MTNTVFVKRSNVPGKAPTTEQLQAGGLAINTADRRLFFSSGDVVTALANLNDLTWGNLGSKPTTLDGFGITDAYTKSVIDAALALKADKATTLAGYGITDAYTKTATDTLLNSKVNTSLVGAANGIVPLDGSSKIASQYLPALAITDTYVVASQAAMLALTAAEVGDIAIRTDLSKTFILRASGYSVLGNWQELQTPTDLVSSVNGQTGLVTISTITGNAGTATKLETARNITLNGVTTGTGVFDGSSGLTITTAFAANPTLPGSEKFTWPSGTTAQRPVAPVDGDGRLNTTTGAYELFYNGSWSGIPKTTAQGVVAARRSTTYVVKTTATDLTFDLVDITTDANICSLSGTNTARFVAGQSGTYLFMTTNALIASNASSVITFRFMLNGVAIPQGSDLARPASTSSRDNVTSYCVVNMAAGDYVSLQTLYTGSASTIQIGSTMLMLKLGGAQGEQGPAGVPGGQSSVYYSAANMDNPTNANWAVNLLAPATADTANAALTVRAFDDTAEEGVGMTVYVPPTATNVTLTVVGKAATAPATAKAAILKLYSRVVGNNVAVAAWSAGTVLNALTIPANAFYQTFTLSVPLATAGLTAGLTGQLEITRLGSSASDTLVGDFHLLNMSVSFT